MRGGHLDANICIDIRSSIQETSNGNKFLETYYNWFIYFIKGLMDSGIQYLYIPDKSFDNEFSIGVKDWPRNMTKDSLARDIIKHGNFIPLVTVCHGEEYSIIDGQHRYLAIKSLEEKDRLNDRTFLMLILDQNNADFYANFTITIPKIVYDSIKKYDTIEKNIFCFKIDGIELVKFNVSGINDFKIIFMYYIKSIDILFEHGSIDFISIVRNKSLNSLLNKGLNSLNMDYQYINKYGIVKHYSELSDDLVNTAEFPEVVYSEHMLNIRKLFAKTIHFYTNLLDTNNIKAIQNTPGKFGYVSTDIDSLGNDILDNGMYLPIHYKVSNREIEIKDGIHRFLAIQHLISQHKWPEHRKILFICNEFSLDGLSAQLSILKELYDLHKVLFTGIRYEVSEYSVMGISFYKITTNNTELMEFIFKIMDREVNALIDNDILSKHHIKPSKIVNKEEF